MIGPYFEGDIPSQSAVIELNRGPDDADLSIFDSAEVTVYNSFEPEGTTLAGVVDGDEIIVAWPEDRSLFTTDGVYTLAVTLTSIIGYRERAEDVYFVVQNNERDGWHTLGSARREWSSGGPSDDVLLWTLLHAARAQCEEYAPTLGYGEMPPATWRTAQLMQARAIFNAAKQDPSFDPTGDLVFTSRPNPLDKFVRNILRPQKAVGFLG
ncbi:hypothetical protein C5C56_06160 [Rathayibacter sp. AY1D1]|uniref:hypothetical protein n=1 Tax=Rathayibacter sp. AY1D1 TaxID=2080542 RepID=UPI000CE76980|nr:hypothetical protein [Rathayibacter sp. AY1D1]PPI00620.1 hypothetical protein C5C56_06160 [Rathayibacter sp. AY1D1]